LEGEGNTGAMTETAADPSYPWISCSKLEGRQEGVTMKNTLITCSAILMMIVTAAMVTPTPAWSTPTLGLIDSYSTQTTSQTGPQNTIDMIISWLGYDPLVGPGGALTGATISGTQTPAVASAASMLNVSWYEFWKIGQTNEAKNTIIWAGIYQLNGDQGESANISLDYIYNNSRLNLVADGRSESKSSAGFYYNIVPASMTDQYSQDALDAYMSFQYWVLYLLSGQTPPGPWMWDYDVAGLLSYDRNYHFAAMTWADDSTSGSFPVGTMAVGDQLYFMGILEADTQAQAYYMGVEIATLVSSLNTELVVTEIPGQVPEPATLLLLGSGMIGILSLRRKLRK
jgi:hypothetical protein